MRVGFIGTGSMGSILLESFISVGALLPSQITASNRTKGKVERLQEKYRDLHVASSNKQTVISSDLVFLCVKPLEFKNVLQEISPVVRKNQLIISITSPVMVEDIEQQLVCRVAKVIPSITNAVQGGASLIIWGTRCTPTDKQLILELFSQISRPIEIDEQITRVCSDIVSCGPAFISYLLQQLIRAAVEETNISKEQATFLTSEMMIGMGKLISDGPFTLETLQQRVCVPGGITGAGLLAFANIDEYFNQLYRNTHAKFSEDVHEVSKMFNTQNT